jgi:lipopolysaccharide export system protein LptC
VAPFSQTNIMRKPAPAPIDLDAWWDASRHADSRIPRSAVTAPREWLRTIKFALPAAGAVLLLLAFIWPSVLPSFPKMGDLLKTIAPAAITEAAMFDLEYQGTNNNGTPYGVTATKAVRDATQKDRPVIILTAPEADLTTTSGSFVALRAAEGHYAEKQNSLDLNGGVEIFHDNGSTFSAPQLAVDFAQNAAHTNTPVVVQGPFGTINASGGMDVTQGGDNIVFKGPTTARLAGSPSPAQ